MLLVIEPLRKAEKVGTDQYVDDKTGEPGYFRTAGGSPQFFHGDGSGQGSLASPNVSDSLKDSLGSSEEGGEGDADAFDKKVEEQMFSTRPNFSFVKTPEDAASALQSLANMADDEGMERHSEYFSDMASDAYGYDEGDAGASEAVQQIMSRATKLVQGMGLGKREEQRQQVSAQLNQMRSSQPDIQIGDAENQGKDRKQMSWGELESDNFDRLTDMFGHAYAHNLNDVVQMLNRAWEGASSNTNGVNAAHDIDQVESYVRGRIGQARAQGTTPTTGETYQASVRALGRSCMLLLGGDWLEKGGVWRVRKERTPVLQIQKARKLDGRRREHSLSISVETGKGNIREGTDPDGVKWRTVMPHDYGYIRGTLGLAPDGDHLDVVVGPEKDPSHVWVFHIKDPKTGEEDEDKVFLNFATKQDAIGAFRRMYDHPDRFYNESTDITEYTKDEFLQMIKKVIRWKVKDTSSQKLDRDGHDAIHQSHDEWEKKNAVAKGSFSPIVLVKG